MYNLIYLLKRIKKIGEVKPLLSHREIADILDVDISSWDKMRVSLDACLQKKADELGEYFWNGIIVFQQEAEDWLRHLYPEQFAENQDEAGNCLRYPSRR